MILYRRLLPKTSVFILAELLAGFGSKLGELTTTVFVIDAGIGGIEIRTVKLTVAEAPLAIFPKLHITVPPCAGGGAVQEASPEFIDRNIDCAGTGSTKVTADAWNSSPANIAILARVSAAAALAAGALADEDVFDFEVAVQERRLEVMHAGDALRDIAENGQDLGFRQAMLQARAAATGARV